jgi:hypothetical protein
MSNAQRVHMAVIIPKIGDWVSFCSTEDAKVLTGYTVNVSVLTRTVLVRVPATRRDYNIPMEDVSLEEPALEPEDIRTLIDLALDLRDEDWFRELMSGIDP